MPAGGLATAATVAAVAGGAQSAFGAYQYLKGRQLAKTAKRPEMDIPRDMYNKLTTAQQMAMEGMSEQERKQYIDNLQRVANFQMQEMGTRKAGLVGAAELGQTQADALTNMAVQSEKLRRENQMYLGQTQSEMAGWKQQQFMANKMAPYMSTVTAANAMQGSGLQNIMGGAQSAASNISAAAIAGGANKPNTIGTQPAATPVDAAAAAPIAAPIAAPTMAQVTPGNMSQGVQGMGVGMAPQLNTQPYSDAQMELLRTSNPSLYYQLMAKKRQTPFSY
jgi:hypothetical protein